MVPKVRRVMGRVRIVPFLGSLAPLAGFFGTLSRILVKKLLNNYLNMVAQHKKVIFTNLPAA